MHIHDYSSVQRSCLLVEALCVFFVDVCHVVEIVVGQVQVLPNLIFHFAALISIARHLLYFEVGTGCYPCTIASQITSMEMSLVLESQTGVAIVRGYFLAKNSLSEANSFFAGQLMLLLS
jgi:hypothetical protein